jgi:hypothetical protein
MVGFNSPFTYIWDQQSYNPITGELTCKIHFAFPDGSRIRDAFTYHWRLWGLKEIREMLDEAGFARTTVYWEGDDDDGGGNSIFTPSERGEACASWVCYITAEKWRPYRIPDKESRDPIRLGHTRTARTTALARASTTATLELHDPAPTRTSRTTRHPAPARSKQGAGRTVAPAPGLAASAPSTTTPTAAIPSRLSPRSRDDDRRSRPKARSPRTIPHGAHTAAASPRGSTPPRPMSAQDAHPAPAP